MLTYKTISEYRLKDECFAFRHTYRDPWDEETPYGPEAHRKFEIIYVVQGEELYNIEGEQYQISDGDIIFVMPNEIHSMIGNNLRPFERILVYFDFEMLRDMFRVADIEIDDTFLELSRVNRVIPEKLVRKHGIKDVIFEMAAIDSSDRNAGFLLMSKIFDLIVRLSNTATDDEESVLPVIKDRVVKDVINYIDDHISEQISLDDIANELYVSKSTLCHKFSANMNISVNRYIATKKIYYAAELIKNGKSANEAAIAAGYDQYTTFYHNYKQIMGRSPSADAKIRRGNG